MGVGSTVPHYHASQAILRHFGQQGRRQLIGNQHKTGWPLAGPLGGIVEME
ncbi:hypothetical protein D3C76_1692960 [compost metagenome]